MEIDYTKLIGIPFKNHGRSITDGLDCYGLVMQVFSMHGIDVDEYDADYKDMKKIDSLIKSHTTGHPWRPIKDISKLPIPCLVAMRFGSPAGVVNHTGAYIGNGRFIHIRERIGVCIDHIDSMAWKRCIVGFYEYVGDIT